MYLSEFQWISTDLMRPTAYKYEKHDDYFWDTFHGE
jgi:hypothetical protein